MRARRRLTGLALALALLPATGQAAELLELYREAVRQDPTYLAAQAEYEASRERVPQARAGLLPSLGLGGGIAYNDNQVSGSSVARPGQPRTDFSGNRVFDTRFVRLQLAQPLFNRENWIGLEQAELALVQSAAELRAARIDLALRLSQAWFDLLFADDVLRFATVQRDAIDAQRQEALARYEAGLAPVTEVDESQARFDLAKADEIRARSAVEVARRALQTVIGRLPAATVTLPPGFRPVLPDPDDIERWAEVAASNNALVEQRQQAFEVADAEIRRQQAGHLPTLSAVASWGLFANTGGNTQFTPPLQIEERSIGLQLNMPLYAGGGVSAATREAVSRKEAARQQLEAARRQASQQARQAFIDVSALRARIGALESARSASLGQLDSTRTGLEVGLRTRIDLLNAQQQVFSTERDLARARYDYLLAWLRLKAATGTLEDEDMAELDRLLATANPAQR